MVKHLPGHVCFLVATHSLRQRGLLGLLDSLRPLRCFDSGQVLLRPLGPIPFTDSAPR